jgi:hypothetical protein
MLDVHALPLSVFARSCLLRCATSWLSMHLTCGHYIGYVYPPFGEVGGGLELCWSPGHLTWWHTMAYSAFRFGVVASQGSKCPSRWR